MFDQAMAIFKGFDPRYGVQFQGHLGSSFFVCGQVVRQGDLSEYQEDTGNWIQILYEKSGLEPVEGVSPLPIWSAYMARL